MSEFLKPQSPLRKGEAYIYPLTTADQVILEDNTRLNAVLENLVTEDKIHNAINAIGALSNNGFSTHSTVLEAAMAMPKQGGSFFAVNGSNLFYAEDTAFSGREVTYLMLTDESSGAARRTVIAIPYGSGATVKYRTIWSGGWQTNWVDIATGAAGGDVSSDHVNDKNNPHGVTASQIGAALGTAYVAGGTNVDTVTQSGMYRLGTNHQNCPSGADWGQLLVVHGGGDTIAQIAFDYDSSRMWVRTGNPSDVGGSDPLGWSNWAQCYTTNYKPTASDIGAIPGTHAKWLPQNGMSILSFPDGITSYSVNPGNMIAEGAPDGFSEYATVTVFKLTEYPYYEYIDVFGNKAIWKANGGGWDTFYSNNFKPTPAAIGAVTAAEVTTMINNALGVIENGAY